MHWGRDGYNALQFYEMLNYGKYCERFVLKKVT